jgi:hypothetical protein
MQNPATALSSTVRHLATTMLWSCFAMFSFVTAAAQGPAPTATRTDAMPAPLADSKAGPVAAAAPDTVRRRPRAVEVSDAYEVRLRIHRYASYATIPLFVVQTVAGNQLYVNGGPNPQWASTLHSAGAAGLGALFAVNTVTGVWNLWDSRGNDVGRTKRLIHSGLMLASDAGFAYAGIKLSSDAKRTQVGRDRHRRVAYISMSAALAGYGVMLFGSH